MGLAKQHYDILIDSDDAVALTAAQKGLQEIIKQATTHEEYVARGDAVLPTPIEEYKDKLLGVFSYFVPVSMSWFKANNEPWVYKHGDTRVPVYPVSDNQYIELLEAFRTGTPVPLKYMSSLTPELKGYHSKRWEAFDENVFLNSGLDNTEPTYQHLSNLMGKRDIPASMKWNVVAAAGHDKNLGHLTATQMLLWLGNDNFDLENAPVLHAAKMREVVQQMKAGDDLSIIKSNIESIGDIPAMLFHGFFLSLVKSVVWAAKTGETVARYAITDTTIVPSDELAAEFGREIKSANDHIFNFGMSTAEYLLDYTDPTHLKRRALYELPMVALDFSMLRGFKTLGRKLWLRAYIQSQRSR